MSVPRGELAQELPELGKRRFPLERFPGVLQFATQLADTSGSDPKPASGPLCRLTQRQRLGDLPLSRGQRSEPGAKVDAADGDFRGTRSLVFDQHLFPFIRAFVVAIQPLQAKTFAALSVLRADIADVQASADLAAVTGLRKRLTHLRL